MGIWKTSWSSNTLATWPEGPTHWKRLWCWERLRAGGEEGSREGDGWMASLTQGTWVWENSRGQGRLACCSPWGLKELDMTWQLNNKLEGLLSSRHCARPFQTSLGSHTFISLKLFLGAFKGGSPLNKEVLHLLQGSPNSGIKCLMIWGGSHVKITDIKCTINVMCSNHTQTMLPSLIHGKIIFHKTGPWCQKCWGPLICCKHSAWYPVLPLPLKTLNLLLIYLTLHLKTS